MVYSKKNIKKNNTLYLSFFCFIILVYIVIYLFFVYPLYNLSKIQSKNEIRYMTELFVQGVNDKSKLSKFTNIDDYLSLLI